MRRVAQQLGTGAASLYAHVSSKEELLELVFDELVGRVALPEPDPRRWREQIHQMSGDLRQILLSHRDVALAGLGRVPTSPNVLRAAEVVVAVMRAGGLSDRAIGLGSDLLALYIGAVAYEESLQATGDWAPETIGEFVTALREYFAALPADRFPNIIALAGALTEGDGETRFEFGLEVLVRGLIAVSEDG